MVAILALGLFLIYRLVGKALAPLDTLTCRIRERTAADLAQPVEIPDSGDEAAAVALAFNQMSPAAEPGLRHAEELLPQRGP